MISYSQTPVQEIRDPRLTEAAVRLFVKREDLNHPSVSGNKWWKLKYNLKQAREEGHMVLLTFGGAYSNHIYATAAAGKEAGFASVGVIRGEETLPLNPTLAFATEMGMRLHYVSRGAYRNKETPAFLDALRERFGSFYLIPEGGSNRAAVRGCAEWAGREIAGLPFDYVFLATATGATLAGVVCGLAGRGNIFGVSVLKDGAFLAAEVRDMIDDFSGTRFDNWRVLTQYHHGGYARTTSQLEELMHTMERIHGLPLDHVYTGKVMSAVFEEVGAGGVPRGSTILMLHTGGLQGRHAVKTP